MGRKTKKGAKSKPIKPTMRERSVFELRGGTGNMNPFAKMAEKGLINPLQEKGRPATDAGGRVKQGDKASGLLEKFAMKDAGGLQYKLLGAREVRHHRIAGELSVEGKETYTDKSKVQAHEKKRDKLYAKQTKVKARREGNRKLRGARNLIVAGTLGGLGLDFEERPVETYTDMYIPKGMDPKDVPSYVNSISTSRSSVNNPEGVAGWVNFNMDPNQSFRYDPETGNVGFMSAQKYRETGGYINTEKKPTWKLSTAVDRVKKAANFVKRNVM